MIDIPKRAKDLLYSDTALKNIIIHFPNGEMADIDNNNIVSEIFSFTESICSGNTLSLGIVESPVIQFECVGVGNFKGCTIEITVNVRESDDSYSFDIPLGIYTVAECKRQADMEHRKVTAYAATIDNDLALKSDFMATLGYAWHNKNIPTRLYIDSIEKQFFYDKSSVTSGFNPDRDTVYQNRIYKDKQGNVKFIMHVECISAYRVGLADRTNPPMHVGETELHEYFDYYKFDGNFKEYLLHCEDFQKSVTNKFLELIGDSEEDISDFYQKYTQDMLPTIVVDTPTSYTREKATYELNPYGLAPTYLGGIIWGDYNPKSSDLPDDGHFGGQNREGRIVTNIPITTPEGCVYNCTLTEKISTGDARSAEWYHAASNSFAKFPVSVMFWFYGGELEEEIRIALIEEDFTVKTNSDEVHNILDTSAIGKVDFPRGTEIKKKRKKLTLNAEHRWTSKETMSTARKEYFSDTSSIEDIQIRNIMASYAELQGKFGRINRYGQFEYIRIGGKDGLMPSYSLYPSIGLHPSGPKGGTVYPSKYLSCWYEDLAIKQIGRIQCSYFDVDNEGTETELIYDIVDDFSPEVYTTYKISNNWLLNNGLYSESDVVSMLDIMSSNIKEIKYTTCSITMVGRPDIEVGDVILVTTEDGNSFETPIFRRTLTGIQLLRDKIEVKATDNVSSSSAGSGGSSSVSGGGSGGFSGVSSINNQTGAVTLRTSDIPDDVGYAKKSELTYSYIAETKTLILSGFSTGGGSDD